VTGPSGTPVSASVPALASGTCQVWWAATADVRPEHDVLLDDSDRQRRARLSLVADRQRTTAAWAVARLLLGAATGVPPDRLHVDRTCPGCGAQHGKPRLPGAPDLHVSVSHAGGCVAVAVARGAAVGVDVEAVVQVDGADLELLVQSTLAPEESAALAGRPDRARAFTICWTRKEAVLKATGQGLSTPLPDLVVSPPDRPPRVLRGIGGGIDAPVLHDLHPPPGHVAALAVLGGAPVRVVEADAGPLLRSFAPG
jgi:4'-phosphopantetheinyl transferase